MTVSDKPLWDFIGRHIATAIGSDFSIDHHSAVQGGDINQSYRVTDSCLQKSFFVKLNNHCSAVLFEAEVAGLAAIRNTHAIVTPEPIALGVFDNTHFCVLEYLPLVSSGDESLLGQQLAKMHRHTADLFGFETENMIGLTPQKNHQAQDWLNFWRDCRLLPQFELAYQKGHEKKLKPLANALLDYLPILLANHKPVPSLVHGDLWGGNKGFLANGTPVIFDPACYYGDREVDIAMTHLFGDFGRDFYRAYETEWSLPEDYKKRLPLYNLYHQLNHLNLFGSSYLQSCAHAISGLLVLAKE